MTNTKQLSKRQQYCLNGKLAVMLELTQKEQKKRIVYLTNYSQNFSCFKCLNVFHHTELIIHHNDFKKRGSARGREHRLTEWRKQLRSDTCCLEILCKKCHLLVHKEHKEKNK